MTLKKGSRVAIEHDGQQKQGRIAHLYYNERGEVVGASVSVGTVRIWRQVKRGKVCPKDG